jgi:hypothetical protein
VLVSAIVIAAMIWVSKSRRSELGEEIRAQEAAASA